METLTTNIYITRSRLVKELSSSREGRYYLDRFTNLPENQQEDILELIEIIVTKLRQVGILSAMELLTKLGSFLNEKEVRA